MCRNTRGLGSSPFARHYSGNHCCFLFLRLLRCFSSAGSPLLRDVQNHSGRVAPFGHLRVYSYLPITATFRSLSRPSSPPGAKASTLRPFFTFSRFRRISTTVDSSVCQCACVGLGRLVENNGFEPLTPCLQSRCSSQLS